MDIQFTCSSSGTITYNLNRTERHDRYEQTIEQNRTAKSMYLLVVGDNLELAEIVKEQPRRKHRPGDPQLVKRRLVGVPIVRKRGSSMGEESAEGECIASVEHVARAPRQCMQSVNHIVFLSFDVAVEPN